VVCNPPRRTTTLPTVGRLTYVEVKIVDPNIGEIINEEDYERY